MLTRLPSPHRLAPADAWALLQANFTGKGLVNTLSARECVALLRRLAADGVCGGRTYDAVIADCAVKAGATALLTFNRRHVEPAPKNLAVVVPSNEGKRVGRAVFRPLAGR